MGSHGLSHADLVSFDNAAAGHDGVLSDASGGMVIKPCTQKEVEFYQQVAAENHALAEFMPKFMGTLQLSKDGSVEEGGTAASLAAHDPGPAHGKKLNTEQSIVLENAAAGFEKPNIIDLKLGARLWDDAAPVDKRKRLDDVANKSTSGSMGFRIAGMRVWEAKSGGGGDFKVFDKMYGRKFNDSNVINGFEEYFGHTAGSGSKAPVISNVLEDVKKIRQIFENSELRMYSASILATVEGDPEALAKALKYEKTHGRHNDKISEDDDDNDRPTPKSCKVVMIDFAHADFTPGQGPDENVLQGIRSVISLLEKF